MDAAAARRALPVRRLRWGLTADQAEADTLEVYAEACETTVVHYTPAP